MAAHVSEERRLREVRKYYVPSDTLPTGGEQLGPPAANLSAPVSSPNQTLTALMQLIACRLGMQRAMVSVVEQHAQHFLAEATRSLDLEDISQHEESLWMGCGMTKRSEALCANTIEVPLSTSEYSCFSICDLSKDERFSNLPYVSKSPHMRFYAGTPLLTQKDRIPIGSVFIIDDRPRGPPTKFEIDFLGIMARNVMDYLEMRRESEMRIRNERMIRCLTAFVDGKSTVSEANESAISNIKLASLRLSNGGENGSMEPQQAAGSTLSEKARLSILSPQNHSSDDDVPSVHNKADVKIREGIPTQHQIFSRASKLMRESLEVDCTMFLDVKAASSVALEISQSSATENTDESREENGTQPVSHPKGSHKFLDHPRDSTRSSNKATRAKVLSFSKARPSPYGKDVLGADFRTPDLKSLQRLMKRYPEGRLWTFSDTGIGSDEEGFISESLPSTPPYTSSNLSTKIKDGAFLVSTFPGARQILFAPVWDVETGSHIAACFAISLEPIPVFENDSDAAFVRGFLNSLSITCGKAKLETANRQKGDFISSISHELRSPLHGILASAELLTGSKLDHVQTEFCNTILTCGQSLLETISDILEFTKINTLRKDARIADSTKQLSGLSQSNGLTISKPQQSESDPPSPLDIARVCEDAVISISTAFMYHTSTSVQMHYRVSLPPDAFSDGKLPSTSQSPVVIVDISPGDWIFCGLSGPIQRIIWNLVGNSLKYTHSGFVKIRLGQNILSHDSPEEIEISSDASNVEIIVTDTGRGISKEFLETKLYSPFSQESTLAPGTGLGLNIVRSLVQLQKGTIDITSEVGTGTNVVVRLPLQRSTLAENSGIFEIPSKTRFSVHGFKGPNAKLVKDSLRRYLTEWYDMVEVDRIAGTDEGFVFVDGEECSSWIGSSPQRHKLIVVCGQSKQQQLLQKYSEFVTSFELLISPFGPHKLSKVLAAVHTSKLPDGQNSTISENAQPDQKLTSQQSLPIREEKSLFGITQASLISPVYQPPKCDGNPKLGISDLPPAKQARILCVDDNAINLRLLKTFMDRLGFKDVVCAENGSIAFEAVRLRPERFDLIFMDLSMPVCDGFEATSLIRSLEKLQSRVPTPGNPSQSPALIVAVTGLASQRDQDAAKAAGIDYFLSKPLKLSRLKELLIQWGLLL